MSVTNSQMVAGDRQVSWLHELPSDWKHKPLKYVTRVNERDLDENTDSQRLIKYIDIGSVTSDGRITNVTNLVFENAPSRARRILSAGDTLVSTVRTYLTAIAFCEEDDESLVCSTGFAVLTPTKHIFPKYLFYWARSSFFIGEVISRSVGVSYPAVNASEVGNLPFPLIGYEQQQAIANFLDDKTARIDELINKKERQLELLAEKRQAVISEAVTKGLNRNAPMRDSGIGWLGEVPAHWETSKVKLLSTKIGSGKTPKGGSQVYVDSGVLFIRSQNVYDDGLRLDDVVYIDEDTDMEMQNTQVKLKDVLLNITGASIGRTCIVPDNLPKANVNQHVCIIRVSVRCVPEYISYCFKSNSIKEQTLSLETGSSREGLNFEQVGNLIVAVPSKNHNEQRQIVDYLNVECDKTDEAVNKIQTQINKLREYRQALITAAVTGKIDVRGEVI